MLGWELDNRFIELYLIIGLVEWRLQLVVELGRPEDRESKD